MANGEDLPIDDDVAPQQKWGCVDSKGYNEVWSSTSPVLNGDIDYMGGNQFCIFDDPSAGPTTGDIHILEIIPKQVFIVKTVKNYTANIDPRGISYDGHFFHVIYKNLTTLDYTYEQIDMNGSIVREIKSISFTGEAEGMCHFIDDRGEYFALVERGANGDLGDTLHILNRNFNKLSSFIMGEIPLGTAFGIIYDGMNFVVANKGNGTDRPGFKIIDPVSEKTVFSIKTSINYNGIAFDGLQIYYNVDPLQVGIDPGEPI